MPRKGRTFDFDDLRKRYLSGEGLEALTQEYGIGWSRAANLLKSEGILRDRKTSQRIWRERAGPERMKEITKNANDSVRGIKWPKNTVKFMQEERAKVLQNNLTFVGKFERQILKEAKAFGIKFIPQLAVGPYNIDLAVDSVAVEVLHSANSPYSDPRVRKRSKELLKRNWTPVYVWIPYGQIFNGPAVTQQLVSLLQFLKRNQSSRSKEWVVRSSGQNMFVGFNSNHWAYIPATIGFANTFRRNKSISSKTT